MHAAWCTFGFSPSESTKCHNRSSINSQVWSPGSVIVLACWPGSCVKRPAIGRAKNQWCTVNSFGNRSHKTTHSWPPLPSFRKLQCASGIGTCSRRFLLSQQCCCHAQQQQRLFLAPALLGPLPLVLHLVPSPQLLFIIRLLAVLVMFPIAVRWVVFCVKQGRTRKAHRSVAGQQGKALLLRCRPCPTDPSPM